MPLSVSLIIAFYNKIDVLRLVFAALETQTYKDFEIVIADDGSRADVVNELKLLIANCPYKVKHVWHEDNGWQKNIILNKAIVASKGDYLIFIDGDCIPHHRFVEEHVENRQPLRVVGGRRVTLTQKVSEKLTVDRVKSLYLEGSVFGSLLFETLIKRKKVHLKHMFRIRNRILRKIFVSGKNRGFWGCNFSISKSDILKVNGFDERYLYPGIGEDTDLENRLKQVNILPLYIKHMLTQYHVYHVHFNLKHEPNILLREENIRNKVSFTPYGIIKKSV